MSVFLVTTFSSTNTTTMFQQFNTAVFCNHSIACHRIDVGLRSVHAWGSIQYIQDRINAWALGASRGPRPIGGLGENVAKKLYTDLILYGTSNYWQYFNTRSPGTSQYRQHFNNSIPGTSKYQNTLIIVA